MGEGEYAYCIEYKMMMTTLLLLSSSLVSLHRMHAASLTVTHSCSPVESFVVLGPWVHIPLSSMGAGYAVIHGHWLFNSCCWWSSLLLGGQCCLLGAGHHLPLAVFCVCGCCILGSQVSLWWGLRDVAVGNVEGAHIVVDTGDVGVWLSCFVVRQLSWFVGGEGYLWSWVL